MVHLRPGRPIGSGVAHRWTAVDRANRLRAERTGDQRTLLPPRPTDRPHGGSDGTAADSWHVRHAGDRRHLHLPLSDVAGRVGFPGGSWTGPWNRGPGPVLPDL